jgi:UDP-3-O-[3-hydroxymyristoyl] N-acetylglucosamine deacetylase
VFLLRAAGVFEQPAVRPRLRIQRPLEIRDGERSIRIEPARELRISYAIDYLHPAIGRQVLADVRIDGETFEHEICRARTFGFLHEVQTLWRLGLARGGNLDNTVVLDEERVLNRDGLRFPDEFVRHKVLDLIGDLALLGAPLEGHVHVERGGHALHQRLLSELLATQRAWRMVNPAPALRGEAPLAVVGAGLS